MLKIMPQAISPRDGTWIDLCDPSEAECREVEQRFGVRVPTLAALSEIESSSRLRADPALLSMSAPLLTRAEDDRLDTAPAGFLLNEHVLVTVRFAPLAVFDTVAEAVLAHPEDSPAGVLVRLLEEVVDRAADQLEHVSEQIAAISRTVFYGDLKRRGLSQETALLRHAIIKLGRAYDRASRVRYMFLSVGRMAAFVIERCQPDIGEELKRRLQSVQHDILSLDEFEVSLSTRIQFLQDAANSLISIEQNDVVKVLTVASVVGIPPVLIVGIYGMNFKNMPELDWHYGYPYALAMCVVTTVIPYLLFKWRKWV